MVEDLIPGKPALTSSIADAIVIKDQNLFLLTDPAGCLPVTDGHGLGLYFEDCRFLRGYELAIAGQRPSALAATARRGFMAIFHLSGPDLQLDDGRRIPQEELGVTWERVVDGVAPALHERLVFENFARRPLVIPVTLTFRAGFEDVFAVRKLRPDSLGTQLPHVWQDDVLCFRYHGVDDLTRVLSIAFSRPPSLVDGTTARFEFELDPRGRATLLTTIAVAVAPAEGGSPLQPVSVPNLERLEGVLQRASDTWLSHEAKLRSDSPILNRVVERSFRDLYLLRSRIGDHSFFVGGVPWFATLFGRDSLLTALQTLAYDPTIAEQTLRLLAGLQGDAVNDWRDEQPGKILHELRTGEMARAGEIPHTPYYGTVDATPLFLILLARHAAWTGETNLFLELREAVERALAWMDTDADLNGDGYLAYQRRSALGLENQGWKDSHDAIVNADGSLATPPIALVEVQGYAYLAKTELAALYEQAGDSDRAARLRQEADELRARFNRDFWLAEEGCYALARQAGGRLAATVSSNAGQVLFTGIADDDKARRTAERLLAEDMFSGWGIRTLSASERCYNPNGYHLGSVWPHDNALILAGLRRYGADEAARRIFSGILDAAMDFDQYRLPELFAGYPREEYGVPVLYPVACRPQAFAAASIPSMIESMLGLRPEGGAHRLRVVRPILPDPATFLELHELRVGAATVTLRFERASFGTAVRVLSVQGPLDVIVEGDGVHV